MPLVAASFLQPQKEAPPTRAIGASACCTYAILDAMNRPEGKAEEVVWVWGIADHASQVVPVISQKEFGFRQVPEFRPRQNFSLGVTVPVLPK